MKMFYRLLGLRSDFFFIRLQVPNCIHRWQRRDGTGSSTQLLTVNEVRGVRESRAYDGRTLWGRSQGLQKGETTTITSFRTMFRFA